jgi:ABC-type branched-subunit amino acid transport system substrate-binding protein
MKLSRRQTLLTLAAVPLAANVPVYAEDSAAVKICQSTALTGPLGDLGQAMSQGAKACFDAVNSQGGVNGRRIELQTLDDGYDVKRALANAARFLSDGSTFALFNCMGTPMIEAMLPQVIETGIPFFAPFTGAQLARPKGVRNIFNIRAGYAEEAEQQVRHLATVGIKRIAIAYQANSFGKEVYDGARAALDKHKLKEAASVTVENTGADADTAAGKLLQSNPEAVIVGLAGKPALDFIKAMRAQRRGLPLYALSVMGAAATLKALGSDGVGVAVSQVVPAPGKTVVPVVREFRNAWSASGTKLEPSHLALEGYINARVFVEALRRTGKNPTRERFIESTWAMRRFDLGGFELGFTEPGRNASRFVELTMVGRDGRFIA